MILEHLYHSACNNFELDKWIPKNLSQQKRNLNYMLQCYKNFEFDSTNLKRFQMSYMILERLYHSACNNFELDKWTPKNSSQQKQNLNYMLHCYKKFEFDSTNLKRFQKS